LCRKRRSSLSGLLCGGAHNCDDLSKLWLERGSTDEEAIDVCLGDQFCCILRVGRSSILDSCGVGDVVVDVLGEPSSDVSMGLLSDSWGSCLSGADGPDWFVGKNDGLPVGNGTLEGFELLLEDAIGLSRLSVFESLSDADNGVQANFLGLLDLLCDELVGLALLLSTLRVTDESPFEFEVLDLVGAELSGEGTVLGGADVLGADLDILVEEGLHGSDVEGDWCDHDLDLFLVVLHGVESLGAHVSDELDGTVGFPVATDDVLSL